MPTTSPTPLSALRADRGRRARPRIWNQVFAALYDPLNSGAEAAGVEARRAELLAGVAGDVLEIGAGTGANLPHYPAGLSSLTLVEPDPAMRRRLSRRQAQVQRELRVLAASTEELPLPDRSVDTVVATFVLCTVDLERALGEVRRVLRPGGRLVFSEHVRADSPGLARWQDRLNRPWRALTCGCNCNRDIEGALRDGGFELVTLARGGLREELALVRPNIWGTAVPV